MPVLIHSFFLVAILGASVPGQAQVPGATVSFPDLGRAGDTLDKADRTRLVDWTLRQPAVIAHLGEDRTRVLSAGADRVKKLGVPVQVARVYIRNYTRGVTHEVTIDSASSAPDIRDLRSLIQPSAEEMTEARELIAADPVLAPFVADESLHLDGGFYIPTSIKTDPCHDHFCLEFSFVRPRKGPVRRVIVDLSSRSIAHRNYPGTIDELLPVPLTEEVER